MKTNRFLAVLSAVLILVFCLTACDSKNDNAAKQANDPDKTANINNAADTENMQSDESLQTKTAIADENDAAEKSTEDQGEKVTVTLYFGDDQAEYVVGEQREISIKEGHDSLYKNVFLELMKGPEAEGLQNTIPNGTELLSINVDKGLCTVDLSSEFVDNSPGGTASETMTLWSVVNTLTELEGIDKVQFLIEGEKREVYTHAVFDKPFTRDESLISNNENSDHYK